MSVPAPARRPIWFVLENGAGSTRRADPAHWVSVYGDLLALLAGGARVTVTERGSGRHVTVDRDEVSERLLYWRGRQGAAVEA